MNLNLSLAPIQLELVARPGAVIRQPYTIVNNSDSTVYLYASVDSWHPDGNDGSIVYDTTPSHPFLDFSLSTPNLELYQPFSLRSNETREITLQIRVNRNALPTDSYTTLFLNQVPSQPDGQPQATGRIGSHILISVSATADTPAALKASGLTISPKIRDIFFTPIILHPQASNSTGFFTKSSGKITITKNDRIIKELPLKSLNVLATSSRTLDCVDGCILHPPFWPGHYTATLQLDNTSPLTMSFYVYPFSLLPLLLLVPLFLFLRRRHHS